MVVDRFCTFDHVTSSTLPRARLTVIASSIAIPAPVSRETTESFCARRTSSSFASMRSR